MLLESSPKGLGMLERERSECFSYLDKIVRLAPKQAFGINDPEGLATLTQLRVG